MFDFIEQGIYQLSVKYYFTNPEMEGENIVRYKIIYTDNTDDDCIILYTQRGNGTNIVIK